MSASCGGARVHGRANGQQGRVCATHHARRGLDSRAGRGSEHLLHLFASHLSELLVGGLVIGLVVGVGRGDAGRQRVGPALAAQGHWPFAQRGDAAPGRGADGRRRALPGGARAVHARGTRAPLSGTARSECACGAAAPRSDVPRGRRSLRGSVGRRFPACVDTLPSCKYGTQGTGVRIWSKLGTRNLKRIGGVTTAVRPAE